ncbi:MAG TPA: STAS domain-containing protein [Thermoanaerobaculia bacterium]|nr:STAS domain-containing protein [Thermoanaerobaculia bacterium]
MSGDREALRAGGPESSSVSAMIVEKKKVGGCTVLVVEGVIKLGESARFLAEAFKRALSEDDGHVLLDLTGINFIDSTGIGELVGYLVRFQEQRRKLILIDPPERVRRLLDVAKVLELFPVHQSVEEALAAES